MATSLTTADLSSLPSNLLNFAPCQYTLVATKKRSEQSSTQDVSNDSRRMVVPHVCRLRTRDNAIGIYAMADPIGNHIVASDVSINMLVEQISEIVITDDTYKDKIDATLQKIAFEIENRLLQMTFDHAEEKVISDTSSVSVAEKLLPKLEEAESGAFLFAAVVTQSTLFITYVGTIRAFLITNNGGVLSIGDERPQFFSDGALHTIDNEDEYRRLQNLDVNLDAVRREGLDRKHSKYTRCLGKLSEKLLSSAASANDVNEARCNPLICEPKSLKVRLNPLDYALVIMTDKVYQMILKSGIREKDIPSDLLNLLQTSVDANNAAQTILEKIEERFGERFSGTDEERHFEDIGLLIHFFQHRMNNPPPWPLPIKLTALRRPMDGEVTVEVVKNFIQKNNEMQQKRDFKLRQSIMADRHERENQYHTGTIEPFVQFDTYESLLANNNQLCQATSFITKLLYTNPIATLDEKLNEYLRENPSLMQD